MAKATSRRRLDRKPPVTVGPGVARSAAGAAGASQRPKWRSRTALPGSFPASNGADPVQAHLATIAPEAEAVLQERQHGTGHAVRIALPPDVEGTVVVLNGDLPLVRPQTLAALVDSHEAGNRAATLLTAEVPDPTGLGRIITGPAGLQRIVEERDADPAERLIREINAGAYAFDAVLLRDALAKLSRDNDQGEEYLTDVLGMLVAAGHQVVTYRVEDPVEALGANDRVQLAQLRALLRDRVNDEWMRAGVSLIDPATTWLDVTVTLARDVVVEPNTQLRGTTVVEEGALVGPDTTLTDVYVGPRASVVRTHGVRSRIGAGAYVGDATIGEYTNIGAATVFVNYDGVAKHHSVIGSYARTGADNMFVAPVEVGDGAYTGAGTVVRRNVPPGALSGSGAAEAAARARGSAESQPPGDTASE